MSAQKLITEHLDLWTSAIASKSSSGRGSNRKIELAGVRKLRELILDLAVRGKLVEQDSREGTANNLIDSIDKEWDRPTRPTPLRRPKKQPEIAEEDQPFSVPQSWRFIRLGDAVEIVRGITFPASEKSKSPDAGRIACLRTSNVQDSIEVDDLLYIKESFVSKDAQYIRKHDIVMSMANSRELVGKVAIIEEEPKSPMTFGGFLGVLRPLLINPKYIMIVLRSPQTRATLIQDASQTTNIANISIGKLNPFVMGLPPLEEQHRIVQKVDELMALCDRLEQQTSDQLEAHETLVDTLLGTLTQSEDATDLADNWARLATHFDTLFTTEQSIDKLKQTILQLAVMGRLVEQDARDAPASELLNMVQDAERRLRNSGKIRGKRSGRSDAHQSPTQKLPAGWEFASLSELGKFSGGKTPSKLKPQFWDGDIPWVTPKDMKAHRINGSEDKVTQLAVDDGLALYPENSIFFVVRSGILRRMFPTAISTVPCTVNQDLKVLTLYVPQLSEYVQLMMLGFEQFILGHLTKTGTTVESLKFDEFANCLFPIPPLAEQGRIKEKVQELLTLCDQLKELLDQASETRGQLADAIVEGALH